MLGRLRAALGGHRHLDERVRRLEAAQSAAPAPPPEDPGALDRRISDAVALNESVLLRRLDVAVESVEGLRAELHSGLRGAREHTEAAVEVAERKVARRIDILRRSLSGAAPGSAVRGTAPTTERAPAAGEPSPVDPELYVAIEDRFRGEPALIADRQRGYLRFLQGLADAEHPVLDVGSGRGEWLRILAEAGIPARGVDSNPLFVAECREAGLEVAEADLVRHLDDLPDGALGAVTMFQVVEHLPFPVLVATLRSVARVLRPGGVLIAETPNALNLRVAASNFWIDPTHQRPLHPEVLVFLAQECGFEAVERLFLNPLGEGPGDLSGLSPGPAELLRRLAEQVDGPGDFSLVAWTGLSDPGPNPG